MKFQTTRFGEIKVDEGDIVHFSQGILGFESLRKFVILSQGDDSPFKWLQSLEETELAFIVIQPGLFRAEYDLDLSDQDATDLGLKDPNEALVYAIVTVPRKVEEMTANLQGPLVINARSNQAKQIIVTNPAYHTRHEILKEMRSRAEALEKATGKKESPKAGREGGRKC